MDLLTSTYKLKRLTPYALCISHTGLAWTRASLMQVSAMLLESATYVILRKITSAICDQSENR